MGNTRYIDNDDDFENGNVYEFLELCTKSETIERKKKLYRAIRKIPTCNRRERALILVGHTPFHVSKHVLSVFSLYFRALFIRTRNSGQLEYAITGISPEVMIHLIQYMTAQEISLSFSEARDLLVSAKYLSIPDLVCDCCRFLKTHLSLGNCLSIWKLTQASPYTELRRDTLVYVLNHLEDVVWSPSSRLMELNLEDLSGILEGDELNSEQEKTAVHAVFRWTKYKPNIRTRHFRTLLQKICFGLFTPKYLTIHVNPNLHTSSVLLPFSRSFGNLAEPTISLPNTYPFLVAMCGLAGHFSTYTVETYNSRLDTWSYISSTDPRPRIYHGTAFLDGSVYIVGGFDNMNYLNSMVKFNPFDGMWTEVEGMNSQRCYVSVAVLDSYIYAMGGFDGFDRLNTAERYDLGTDTWHFIPCMIEKRSDFGSAILNGKIYVCGGFNGNEILSTAECFDPVSNQWTIFPSMLTCRSGFGFVTLHNRLFAVGGFNGIHIEKRVEAFDPYTNTWRFFSPMSEPRYSFGFAVMEGHLYVICGKNYQGIVSDCECYDAYADQWFYIQGLNIPRCSLSCCVVPWSYNAVDYTMSPQDSPNSSIVFMDVENEK